MKNLMRVLAPLPLLALTLPCVAQAETGAEQEQPMSQLNALTWDTLIETEQVRPVQATRDRAIQFFTQAGYNVPRQLASLQIGDLAEGEHGVQWPGGAAEALCTPRFIKCKRLSMQKCIDAKTF